MLESSKLPFIPWFRASRPRVSTADISIDLQRPSARVSAEYLSFCIDISVLAGGLWWEGSRGVHRGLGTKRVDPIDLSEGQLDTLVKALGPSYLRVGGSEADKIHYFCCATQEPEALILRRETWDQLHAFIRRNQLKFVFTFKYGVFKGSEQGKWQGGEVQPLLAYSRQQGYTIDVCELGNELNAYWALHGLSSQPGAKKLAQDYATFAELVKHHLPHAKIAGPGSAFWPKLGEVGRPFSAITQPFLRHLTRQLDILTWHFYPFQSERSPIRTRSANLKSVLAPKSFESFATYSQQLQRWRDVYQPNADIWTGETGSAQCGGQAEISDRFASCFWWCDQLGRGATLGQQVMLRQSLVGGDYGLIDRESLEPRPDFWLSWLWVQLMGQDVYPVSSTHDKVRAYCHRHPRESSITLLLINLAAWRCEVNCRGFDKPRAQYTVTATDLAARHIMINGIRPCLQQGQISLDNFPQLPPCRHMPPRSISFWRIDAAAGE